METWLAAKNLITAEVGLERDALLFAVSIAALLLAALITRRPLSSFGPWLTVLALSIVDELISAARPGASIAGSLRDVLLVMAMPTVLLLLTRYLPTLMVSHSPPLRIMLPLRGAPPARKPTIVDAEYEEVSQEEAVPAAASRS